MPGSSSVNFRAAWGPGKDVENRSSVAMVSQFP